MPLHDISASPPSGQVYERSESLSANNVSGTSGSPDTIWTSSNYAFDGSTRVKIEFWGQAFNYTVVQEVIVAVYFDGSILGGTPRIIDVIFPVAGNDIRPVYAAYWDTPSAGVHNYGLKSWSSIGHAYDITRNIPGAVKMSRDNG